MNIRATLRVAQAESALTGSFIALPDYKYTCANISFKLTLNADISKKDSVLKAISEYKENYGMGTGCNRHFYCCQYHSPKSGQLCYRKRIFRKENEVLMKLKLIQIH